MTISTFVLLGDSLAQNKAGSVAVGDGGRGGWPELVAENFADLQQLGPVLSSGMRGVWLGVNTGGIGGTNGSEWSQAGSWTKTASTDAFDKAPYGWAWYGSGATNIVTYTKPAQWRTPVGFAIYWIDKTSGGNWSYSIDGGAYTAMGQTIGNDNGLKKFYVSSTVTSTVAIRAADSSGSAVGCLPVGIELYWADPTVTNARGVIIHNLGVNGEQLHTLCASTSGDRLAFLDSITLGTGNPIASRPNAGTLLIHINDVLFQNSTTTWAADLTTFNGRAGPLGTVGIVSSWENSGNATDQANYRAQTKTSAAGFSPAAKVLDIYDQWSAQGWTGYAAANAAGLILDGTHLTQAGQLDVAPRVFWFVRTQFTFAALGTTAIDPFTVGSSQVGGNDELAGILGTAADNASATGAAANASKSLAPTGAVASATGAANNASITVSPPAGNAAGAGAANGAASSVAPNAANAAGTGTANNAALSDAATGGNAAGTATANSAAGSVKPTAGNALATGAANNATISTLSGAPAGNAAATGTAANVGASVQVTAGVASGTGTANNATAAISPATGNASASAVASPTVSIWIQLSATPALGALVGLDASTTGDLAASDPNPRLGVLDHTTYGLLDHDTVAVLERH